MGVYLSTPNTEVESEDGHSSKLVFGAASMQGWRVGQEDAHIAVVDYDTDTSLFGVFDGHGGPEVAKYCAQHLPTFIKSLNSYKNNQLFECLEESFLQFDQTLIKPEVIEELKILSGNQDLDDDNDTDDDINEAILLREEADLPIGEVMARYSQVPNPTTEAEAECSSSSSRKPALSVPSHMKNEMRSTSKPVSPFLRAKRNIISDSNHQKEELCSSSNTSTATSSACPSSSSQNEVSNSDSHSTSQPDSTNKMDSESPEELVTKSEEMVDSSETKVSNLSNGELISTNENTDCEPTSSIRDVPTNDDNTTPSDIGSKTTSDSNSDANEADCGESGDKSLDSLPYKGKGKHKKIITPKTDATSTTDTTEETVNPIYELFLGDFDEEEEESDDESEEEFENKDESSDDEEEDEESSSDDSEIVPEEEGIPAPCYERPGYDSGCTAVVALLKNNELVVANAGDSRCVVSRNGIAIEMSIDHKPEDDIERNRVEKAGGKVTNDGRVNGGLNLSRAIGDHAYKRNKRVSDKEQMITALPDIKTLDLQPSDQFMVIACDGIWNSLTSQQVIDFVGQRISKTDKLSSVCDELFRKCLAPNTHGDGTGCDNMTAVIVKFVNTTPKRKLEDNENGVNHSEIEVKTGVTEGPELKRIKSNDCVSDELVTDGEAVNEIDGKVL